MTVVRSFRRVLIPLALASFLAQPTLACAQGDPYPSKPIRLVSCCAGIIEAIARAVGEQIAVASGQPVVVETKPGASGMLAAEYSARSKPDGYTVFIGTNSTHAANQSLFKKVPYDFVRDFVPVTGIGKGAIMLVVNPSLPVKTVAELTALAKQRPGKLSFGWGSSSTRVSMELYKQSAGIDITQIPYKTNPQATADVARGADRHDVWRSAVGVATGPGRQTPRPRRFRALAYSGCS